jgi:arylsulfatase A-like enzyme
MRKRYGARYAEWLREFARGRARPAPLLALAGVAPEALEGERRKYVEGRDLDYLENSLVRGKPGFREQQLKTAELLSGPAPPADATEEAARRFRSWRSARPPTPALAEVRPLHVVRERLKSKPWAISAKPSGTRRLVHLMGRMRSSAMRLLAGVLILGGCVTTAPLAGRPNVIVILADDLGWGDLGHSGSDLHETPNLDRLAAEGLRFVHASAAAPVCTPTRAALLTGKHPARLGMTVWRENASTPPRNRALLSPVVRADLPLEETTLSEALTAAGYAAGHVGKWHLGDEIHSARAHGFEFSVGGDHWGAPTTYFHPYSGPWGGKGEMRHVPGLEGGRPGDYLTDRETDEALRFIEASRERPFFLYLAFHAPHTPLEGKPDLVAHYARKIRPGLRHANPTYAAMVHSVDENVGRVLRRIDTLGLRDRTVVIFSSDNGGYIGSFAGARVTDNSPLRSGKGSLYEGGLRVPLIVRWPGLAPAGAVCAVPVTTTDLYPTILEIAGIPRAGSDGTSLVPLLQSPRATPARGPLFWHFPHYYATTSPVSAVRRGPWKLLEYHEDRRTELYDLDADPHEQLDVSAREPERTRDLLAQLVTWRREIGAQMPVPNPERTR